VAVEQQRARRARGAPLAKHRGIAAGLDHAGAEPERRHAIGEPVCAETHALGLLAHAVAAEELEEDRDLLAAALVTDAIERAPVGLGRGHAASIPGRPERG